MLAAQGAPAQDRHQALVQATGREQVLKPAAVRRLRALTFLVEAFQDFVALTAAVFLAGAKLGRQAEILGLLFRADANVDHRAEHDRQVRPIREHGAFSKHDFYSGIRQWS